MEEAWEWLIEHGVVCTGSIIVFRRPQYIKSRLLDVIDKEAYFRGREGAIQGFRDLFRSLRPRNEDCDFALRYLFLDEIPCDFLVWILNKNKINELHDLEKVLQRATDPQNARTVNRETWLAFQKPPAFIVDGYQIRTHHIRYGSTNYGTLLQGNRIKDFFGVDSCRSSTDAINYFYNERMKHEDVSIIIEEIPAAVLLAARHLGVLEHYTELFQKKQRSSFEKRSIELQKLREYHEALYPPNKDESCCVLL
jgi:hypothetical protein